MKKNMLYVGIIYFICGILLVLLATFTEFSFEAFIWGLSGAALGPGVCMILQYMYWSKPENPLAYYHYRKYTQYRNNKYKNYKNIAHDLISNTSSFIT